MPIMTAARLAALEARPLTRTNWHYLSAAVLNVCNRPSEIPILYKYALERTTEAERARLTAEFRESIFKTIALIGIPRTINSLSALKDVTPQELRATELLRPSNANVEEIGSQFFSKVYGKITKRVHGNMRLAYPDLDWFVTKHEYGPLLGYCGVLTPKATSLVVIASLVPQDVDPQLKGHLKGALNNGATKEEVNSVRDLAIEVASWCDSVWRHPISKL